MKIAARSSLGSALGLVTLTAACGGAAPAALAPPERVAATAPAPAPGCKRSAEHAAFVPVGEARQSATLALARFGERTIAFVADEEAGGLGAREYVAARGADADVVGCIVAEPTGLRAVHAGRGTANIDIAITGKAAHSGRPQDGCSAIAVAGQVLSVIADDGQRLVQRPHPELGPATWNVGTIVGGQGINVVAADCRLGVDRRLLPDEDIAAVADDLRGRIDELDLPGQASVTVTVDSETPAFATALDDPLTVGVCEALASLGLDPVPQVWSAACDAGFLHRDLGIRSIVVGPGDINTQAHQVDESVVVDDLLAAAKLYALIAFRLLR